MRWIDYRLNLEKVQKESEKVYKKKHKMLSCCYYYAWNKLKWKYFQNGGSHWLYLPFVFPDDDLRYCRSTIHVCTIWWWFKTFFFTELKFVPFENAYIRRFCSEYFCQFAFIKSARIHNDWRTTKNFYTCV